MSDFESLYRSIMKNSDAAIDIETSGKLFEAYSLYIKLITDIDNLLCIPNKNSVDSETFKIINTKKANLQKLRDQICECIDRVRVSINTQNIKRSAFLLYSMKSDCQYCKIVENGKCDKPSDSTSLEIFKFKRDPNSKNKDDNEGFIVVGNWVGSLIKNISPVLVTKEGILLFIDPSNPEVKVSITLPYDISNDEFQRLITILSTIALVVYDDKSYDSLATIPEVESEPAGKVQTRAEVIAHNVDKATASLSEGIITGASKLGELMIRGSDEICNRTQPIDNVDGSESEQSKLNPNLVKGLDYARRGSHSAVVISGKALSLLMQGTQYVVSKATPHIKSAASPYIPEEWKQSGPDGKLSKIEQVGCVAGSGVRGIVNVFNGLQTGAVICGRNFTRGTSKVVRHKYGDEYGKSTENALYSAGNLGLTAYNAGTFTKSGILKSTATVTAMEMTNDTVDHSDKDKHKDTKKTSKS